MNKNSQTFSNDLESIPGIGPSLAADLRKLGIDRVGDLRNRDPEKLYTDLCALKGVRQDPCVLYAFRCAVYYSGKKHPDPELLKWWNWKDRKLPKAR